MIQANVLKSKIKKVCQAPSKLYKTIIQNDSLLNDAVDLSIVAIIKNEGNYIEEWVRYHILVGVQRFYLYDNGSTDNTDKILKKYVDAGYVKLIDFPGIAMQLKAYNDAISKYKRCTKYMAIIDADEFLYSCNRNISVREQLDSIFYKFPKAGGVAVNWRMFGSGGLLTKPTGGYLIIFCTEQKKMGEAIVA